MRTLALLMVATALGAQDPVDSSGWMGRGVQEFQAARYPAAVAAFERAVAIDPSNVSAQLYLATAYMQQFIPDADSPENLRLAEAARTHFLRLLDLDPSNAIATASIASLFLNQKKWDDALQWYEKLVAVEPNNADAYYSMGFIAWARWYPAYSKARADLGMRQEEPGPIKDAGVRADLTARYGLVIESGMRALGKALKIRPDYDDAMAYMNLLIRERADLRDTAVECQRDVAIADEWVRKALATKKAKAEQRNANVMVDPPPAGTQATPTRHLRISDLRQPLRKVPPIYPPLAQQAQIQGEVRLDVEIDKQGRVSEVKVISGHPLLIQAAIESVKQWEWSPTLLNGQPVEVVTEVSVLFKF
jgi:TonB family protein